MKKTTTLTVISQQETFTFVEVCKSCHLKEEDLGEILEYGIFREQASGDRLREIDFDLNMLDRVQRLCRLQQDLGVNLQGGILALELLDELSKIRDELGMLRRHIEG